MQTPKARNGSVEVSQRISPSTQTSVKSSPSTNRTVRKLKVTGLASDSTASPNSSGRTPRNRSSKVLERGSPRSQMTEKKRPAKLSELESQLAQLENEFKRVKDQLNSSETLRQCALKEAEETRKQLVATSARLEESQRQLEEISASEDDRVQELRKLSQERDRVWQSELEAIQKQHSMDSAALASALNEIQRLKRRLEMVASSEATQSRRAEMTYAEIESLRIELSETVSLVENMRKQLSECKGSEEHALRLAKEAQMQLQEAMTTADSLRSEAIQAKDAYNSLTSELEKSKEKACSLEILVKELETELKTGKKSLDISGEMMPKQDDDGNEQEKAEADQLKDVINSLKLEVSQLKSALEACELRYQDEYIRSTLEIRNAFDQVEHAKSESSAREAQLEAELKKAVNTIDELKSELSLMETVLQNTSAKNKNLLGEVEKDGPCREKLDLDTELQMLKGDLQDLKAVLLDKENQIQSTVEENEMLKAKMQMKETERTQAHEAAEAAKVAEREALMKLGCETEEADRSSRKAARVTEQLVTAQTANAELEAELRRLKVQSDQWRKAAEAAAAMLSQGNNGKLVDRTLSLNNNYNTIATRMDSPLSDEMDDDSPKKKNGNMLKKFGVLWKKGQK